MRRCASVAVWLLLGCTQDSSRRTQEQLASLQKKKAAEAKAADAPTPAPPPPSVQLQPPYDEAEAEVVMHEGRCPDGLWALFPGAAPGATPEEKRANEARRAELARALVGRRFIIKLRAPTHVVLQPHDAPKGHFLIDVAGLIDCSDALGRISIAWTPATASEGVASAVSQGAEVVPNVWRAASMPFELPMTNLSEAKAFYEAHRLGISARVAVRVEKGLVDRKLRRLAKVSKQVSDQNIAYGGGQEDWGAGRLVRTALVGVRVAVDRERKELFDRRESP